MGVVNCGEGVEEAVATASGIWTTPPHAGHLPFLPAVPAGVRTSWWQDGQENSIGTGKFQEPKSPRTEKASAAFGSSVLHVVGCLVLRPSISVLRILLGQSYACTGANWDFSLCACRQLAEAVMVIFAARAASFVF